MPVEPSRVESGPAGSSPVESGPAEPGPVEPGPAESGPVGSGPPASGGRATRDRVLLVALAALLAALDLGTKALAEATLVGAPVDLGVIELRVGYNSGVSFGLGGALPVGAVLALTGAVVLALAVYAWRSTTRAPRPVWLTLAVVLGGAVGNLVDRAVNGAVTDFLHTGWFPTFNTADVFITCGAVGFVLATFLADRAAERREAAARRAERPDGGQPAETGKPVN